MERSSNEEEKPEKSNLPAFISIVSGVLLVISGTQGYYSGIGVYGELLKAILSLFEDTAIPSALEAVGKIPIFLASIGGFSVIIGGFLLYASQVRLGKLIVAIGAGIGIPELILALAALISSRDVSALAQYQITGWAGIVLSIIARAKAK